MNLDQDTRALLEQRGRITLAHIARQTGVGPEWLKKYAQGHIDDPGVNKVQKVHDYLFRALDARVEAG